jgi:hypothetical protein
MPTLSIEDKNAIDLEIKSLRSETDIMAFDERLAALSAKVKKAGLFKRYERKLVSLSDRLGGLLDEAQANYELPKSKETTNDGKIANLDDYRVKTAPKLQDNISISDSMCALWTRNDNFTYEELRWFSGLCDYVETQLQPTINRVNSLSGELHGAGLVVQGGELGDIADRLSELQVCLSIGNESRQMLEGE